ncbi:MAG: SRPBCC family protein [Candidatus Limnocylindria bacterium]
MGEYAIRMQFDIDADEEAVGTALRTEDGVRAWWSKRTDGPADGKLRVSFPDRTEPFEFNVRDGADRVEWVTGAYPPWWAGTTIRWDLGPNPDGPGTRLQFSHGGYEAHNPVIPIVTPAWAQIILRLKAYAESGRPQPFFDF